MIIEGILQVILTLAKALFSFINLPSFPQGFKTVLDSAFSYIDSATAFVMVFFDVPVLRICIDIFLSIISFKYAYKFIMWVIGVIGRIKSGAEL